LYLNNKYLIQGTAMTSQINPNNVNGNFPIAGVPNSTQGFRDNFTNIKTNFEFAETEIDDLQSKAILKAALTGGTLDNNVGNNLVYNARVQGISGTLVQIANTSGFINIDASAGPYQSIVMGGNINLAFTANTWPSAGAYGKVRLEITGTSGQTITLPTAVSQGTLGIQGINAGVITLASSGTYEFDFSTSDGGANLTVFDLNRPLSYYTNPVTITANTASANTATGALIVAGGVGIGGNLNVAGNLVTYTSAGNVAFSALTTGFVELRVPAVPANTAGALNIVGSATGAYQPIYNAGSMLHITGNDGQSARVTIDTFGTGSGVQSSFVQRLARGTADAPTAVQSGDILARITGSGYGNTGYVLAAGNIGTLGIDFVALENYTTANAGSSLKFYTSPIGAVTKTLSANVTANVSTFPAVSSTGNVLTSAGNVLITGGTGGVGYTNGAGGAVNQLGNKSTGVTLNKQSGDITTQATNLGADTIVSFVLTNSTIGTSDLLLLQHQSGGTIGSYSLNASCSSGSATIYIRNNTAGTLGEALVIRYAVIKGAVA
jgi:hypothetical protein